MHHPWLLAVSALLASLLALAPAVSGGINHFDEGFVSTGAVMILRGDLPVRDFYILYGPAQYHLTAALYGLFGENLLVSRAAHVVMLALLGAAVAGISSKLTQRRWPAAWCVVATFVIATGISTPNSGYPAVPGVLLLMGAALVLSRWARGHQDRDLVLASCIVGLVGLFRWDFAIFGFMALCTALVGISMATRRGRLWRTLGLVTAPGAALLLVGFAPFVVLGGAVQWFVEVPRFLLLEFKQWRNTEFVGPMLSGLWHAVKAGDAYTASRSLSLLSMAAWPLVAAPTAIVIAGLRLWRGTGQVQRADVLALTLGVMALLLHNQMRVRSGFPQGYPSFVAALPLLAYLWPAAASSPVSTRSWRGRWSGAVGLALLLVLAYAWQGELRVALARQPAAEPMARGGAVRVSANNVRRMNNYSALVAHVRATTRPGEPILSGVTDISRLHSNDAMLYFLVDRPPATRFMEMEPGLTNTAAGQRELVANLQRRRVRTLVLMENLSTEPNATSRSNGQHQLDAYIHAHYADSAKFGNYTVKVLRPGL